MQVIADRQQQAPSAIRSDFFAMLSRLDMDLREAHVQKHLGHASAQMTRRNNAAAIVSESI